MRVLIIDDEAKAEAQRVLDYALDPAHWYRPGIDSKIPGNNPDYVARIRDGFRCVFTITRHGDGFTMRHLSISVPGEDRYPNVAAAFMIAELFGFTGWDGKTIDRMPDGWMPGINRGEHCIALGQAYEKAQATA
jgi:hypothetical protein